MLPQDVRQHSRGTPKGEVWLGNPLSGEKAQPGAIPAEWALVTGFRPLPDLQVTLSGGSRIGGGLGAPDVRGIVGVHWAPKMYHPERNPSRYDTDGDGIVDIKDRCVEQPEDFNGVRDKDGCPDAGGMVSVNFEIMVLLVPGFNKDVGSGIRGAKALLHRHRH